MARTDRGVFSARVQEALLADDRIRHLRGRVAHAVARDERIRLTLQTERGGERLETVHGFDLVIDGSGADAMWFVPLLRQDALDLLELGLGGALTGDTLPGVDRLRPGRQRRRTRSCSCPGWPG